MRKTFLEYVAEDLLKKYGTDLSRITLVFPNKRASLFLNEHLARMADGPLWSPVYTTISQLFRDRSERVVADNIKLVCDLYRIYVQCTGTTETLDHFYGWGMLMLSDFDDIDKNLADATDVFRNLSNIHELDDVSYLSEEQREVLKRFFSNFSDDYNTELKNRFLQLWQNFGNIYNSFNAHLQEEGLAYEGALYREVVNNDLATYDADTYIFVGFNMLQKVEQKLFTLLAKAGKAKFYWDFDRYYMEGANNEAGYYIRQYLEAFPNELFNRDDEIYNNFRTEKVLRFISASTETIQGRFVGHWLQNEDFVRAGRKTAVVLCDENLLQTVVHSLPSEVENVNITTGFPLAQSPVFSFVNALINLQTIGYTKSAERYRLQYVRAVLRHPYSLFLSDNCTEQLRALEEHHTYYPSRQEMAVDEGLTLIFANLEEGVADVQTYHAKLVDWILSMLKTVGKSTQETDDHLMKEAIYRMYTLFNRLHELIVSGDLSVDLITLLRLITQLVQSTSIPFHGEPAIGLQVMGVLETRNIDFDNVLLLSCNEGNMPKGVNDASFIPYAIRKAHSLTTIDHKVAIYSYYFHRLLQRAQNITILYNNATEDGHTGEMSRFMLQMLVESGHKIERLSLQAGQMPNVLQPHAVEKTDSIMQQLMKLDKLSPTAINRYLRCQLLFFYNTVAGLKESDEETDDIDNRTFGNIFHKGSQLIYEQLMDANFTVSENAIKDFLADKSALLRIVDRTFNEELFKVANANQHPQYNGLQLINRGVIISYLKKLLQMDLSLTPFRILAMEKPVEQEVVFDVDGKAHNLTIGGYVDRLDEVEEGNGKVIRVVDYKTGRKPQTAVAAFEDIFSGDKVTKNHADYYLQTFLYAAIVRDSLKWNKQKLPVSPALLFIQQASAEENDPVLRVGKERISDIAVYHNDFWAHLKALLSEIFNKERAFMPTKDRERCPRCPYRQVCYQ
ncbi:PD-(D/E)XK nuclease family protein [Hoylesella shahii]|uniref:PD-(D/E)XK nuclease superfamily protein n=1 Tax=Hoylesella shahii DSM 15611 = JCM 12083 TaxID=1122991 RepID=A0A318HTC9_9BACT|nr:PD-(D/E)XK nuclease family protein [Hoylesella shahii]PXX17722.1 PD-(D/E)XK nuclease superfamily protein [Hoylesella shahii DSM 15611 = JCM 12083]